MAVRSFFQVLLKRWLLIVAATLVGLVAAIAVTLLSTVRYEATAVIFVSTSTDDSAQQLAQGNTFVQARVQSYTDAATSPDVTEEVVRKLSLAITPQQLAARITADAPLNKVLINIHVTDGDASMAASLTNAVAGQFSQVVEQLETTQGSSSSPVKLTVIQPATTPGAPVSPRPELNLIIGLLAGLIVGVGIALLRDTLDNTVKTAANLALISDRPVIGVVPWDRRAIDSPIAFRVDGHGTRAEAFRSLRTNFQFIDIDNPPRIVAIASALPGEGKTHTTLNLAAALAEAGQRVCVIEADLRRPTIAVQLGVVREVGLTSVLIGKASVEEVLQNAGPNFAVMTSGELPPNPSELLGSRNFRTTLDYIVARVDTVIVDTAPLLAVADGAEVAALADATVLVVKAGKTTNDQVRRSIEALDKVGVVPVGTVLTMTRGSRGSRSEYYYYYTDPTKSASSQADDRVSVTTSREPDVAPEVEVDK